MKKRKLLIGGLMALAIITTTACNNENSKTIPSTSFSWIGPTTPPSSSSTLPVTSTTPSSSALEPQEKYTEQAIKVYYKDSSEDHKIRFYENSPEIPYLGIKDYYELLLKKSDSKELSDLAVTTADNIHYTITSPRDANMTINVKDNYLSSAHFSKFINTSSFIKTGESTSFDGSPWIKIESVTSNEISHPKYIDFNSYSIDIYGDNNDVYLPVNVLSDMFSGMNLLYSAYNRKDLYIINGEANEDFRELENYNDDIFKTPATQNYVDFTYNSFCLFYDHFAGRPGRTALEKYYDLSYGLDKALDQRPLGRIIKEYLHSQNIGKYMLGLETLGQLVHDGGHTRLTINNNLFSSSTDTGLVSWFNSDITNTLVTLSTEIKGAGYEELAYTALENTHTMSPSYPRYFRKDALGTESVNLRGTKTYYEKDDIAIICLDDFSGDGHKNDDWASYYNGETNEIPYTSEKGGSVAAVFKGLERAHANPNIKYVAIDIAGNSGGSSDELMYVVSLLAKNKEGRNSFFTRNQLDNNITTTKFKIDRNLDRKFDENDDSYDAVGDLKIFVITSINAFSCGGITPIYLHDYGIPVVGDNSGGGSCAILMHSNALGFIYRFAAPFNVLSPTTLGGIDHERKYVCDYFIEHPDTTHPDIPKKADGTDVVVGDYSNYYNLDYLSNLAKTVIFK